MDQLSRTAAFFDLATFARPGMVLCTYLLVYIIKHRTALRAMVQVLEDIDLDRLWQFVQYSDNRLYDGISIYVIIYPLNSISGGDKSQP